MEHLDDLSLEQRLAQIALKRVGFFDAVQDIAIAHHRMETEASDPSLNRDNPRFCDIRQRYKLFNEAALAPTQWSEAVASKIDFRMFRGESAFMWQMRDGNVPLTYLATYLFQRCSHDADILNILTEDSAFWPYGIETDGRFITRDLLDSVAELGCLRKLCGLGSNDNATILDIGSGYGRLAWRLSQCFPQSRMLCVDTIPESAFLCEYYLKFRRAPGSFRMVPLPSLEEEMKTAHVDIAVAVNSLTECSACSIEWWLRILSEFRIAMILIVPHAAFDEGRMLLSCEALGVPRVDLTSLFRRYGYLRRVVVPKYGSPEVQRYGISPTYYHIFERSPSPLRGMKLR